MSKSYVAVSGGGHLTFTNAEGKTKKYVAHAGIIVLDDDDAKEFDKMLESGKRSDLTRLYRPIDRETAIEMAKRHQAEQQAAGIAGGLTAGAMTEMMNKPAQLMEADRKKKSEPEIPQPAPSNS